MKNCPICKSSNHIDIEYIETVKIIDSYIYDNIEIRKCNDCGHEFNSLCDSEIEDLKLYYDTEYAINRFTTTKTENDYFKTQLFDKKFYKINQNDIHFYTNFLLFLNEINEESNPILNPILFDFIAIEQFLEHCWNIDNVIQNLKSQLCYDGLLYISIPNSDKYDDKPEKIYKYWYQIKEHIQHFNKNNVIQLFQKHGFDLIQSRESELDILGGKIQMPNLEFLFRNTYKNITDYSDKNIYCYGIGREFMYMIENSWIKDLNIMGLIDDTPSKIGKMINNKFIQRGTEVFISTLPENSHIIITALYHKQEIVKKLKELDYRGTWE